MLPFSAAITIIAKEKGLTIYAIAKKLSKPYQRVHSAFYRKTDPRLSSVFTVAGWLNVKPHEIVKRMESDSDVERHAHVSGADEIHCSRCYPKRRMEEEAPPQTTP